MHRQLLALALTFCTLPAIAQGASQDQLFTATRQQLDVTKVLIAQQSAWNKGDLDAYLSHYKDAADTQAILGSPIRGIQNIRTLFHANFPNALSMGSLEQTEIEVRALGDTFALATGKYELNRPKKFGGPTMGAFTDILEKTPTGWQIIYSETT